MKEIKLWALLLVLATWFIASGEAIYSDQMGVADWHRMGVGSVTSASFSNGSQLLVGTKQGVLASLDPSSGEINWRRRVSPAAPGSSTQDEIVSIETASDQVVVVSGPAQLRVSLWKQKSGELLWDSTAWNVSGSSSSSSSSGGAGGVRGRLDIRAGDEQLVDVRLIADQTNDQRPDVLATFRQFGLVLRSGRTGQVVWRLDVQSETGVSSSSVLHVVVLEGRGQGQALVVCQTSLDTVQLLRIDLTTGRSVSSQTITDVQPLQAVFLSHYMVLLDASGRFLVPVQYHSSSSSSSSPPSNPTKTTSTSDRVDIRKLDRFTNVDGASIFVQTMDRRAKAARNFVLRLPNEQLDCICAVDNNGGVSPLGFHPLQSAASSSSSSKQQRAASTSSSFEGRDYEAPLSYLLSQDGKVLLATRQELAYTNSACALSDVLTPRALQLRGVVQPNGASSSGGGNARNGDDDIDTDDTDELVIELQLARQPGIKRLFLSPPTSAKQTVYVLMVRNDDSLLLYRSALAPSSTTSATLMWSREESLSSVTKAVFVDLPRVTAGLSNADVVEHLEQGLLSRLSWHIQQLSTLQTLPATLAHQLQHQHNNNNNNNQQNQHQQYQQYQQQSDRDEESHRLLSDTFGFRKLLLLLTSVGRVFAFDTQSGQIVWSIYYPCAQLDDLSIVHDESSSAAAVVTTPKAMVLLRPLVSSSSSSVPSDHHVASILDVLTIGQPDELERRPLGFPASTSKAIVHTRPLTLLAVPSDGASTDANLIIDEASHTCHLLSHNSTGTSIHALYDDSSSSSNPSIVHVTVGSNYLQGHTCSGRPVWQRRFASSTAATDGAASSSSTSTTETIIGTAVFPDDYAVSAPIKVFGNSSIATKYINPNKIVVATRSLFSTASNKRESILNVYVIDTIVGTELLHYSHRYGDGPVLLYQADNWVGYQYWHTQASRFEFVSIDLYYPNNSTSSSSSSTSSNVFSSYDRVVPVAHSAAFIAPDPLTAMTTTKSLLGITPRHLLWIASSSRVLAIDGRFIDPRRPVGQPSDDDRAEELLPYYPELTSPIRGHLSYNLSLLGLDHIEAHPTDIESTTLVFAFGLDLFFTRYAPAHQFDLLQEEFNKPLLVVTVAIVLLLSAVTTLLNRRKLRNFYWD